MTPEEFKQARLDANLTQSELAILVGMTDRAIRRYEAGAPHPTCCKVLEWVADGMLKHPIACARAKHAETLATAPGTPKTGRRSKYDG